MADEDFSAYFDLTRAEKGYEVYIDGALQDGLDLEPVGSPDYNETRHLLECMRDGKRPWSTLEDAVEPRVARFEALEVGLDHFAARNLSAADHAGQLDRVAAPQGRIVVCHKAFLVIFSG